MQTTKKLYNLQSLNFLQNTTLKVGILGGSFDPAHRGHYLISTWALKAYNFDYIIWLVANQNPFKRRYAHDINQRGRRALLIARGHPKIIVTRAEGDLGATYTYDSLKTLKKRFPSVCFTLLMGMDNTVHFHKWYKFEAITRLCNIIIFDRPVRTRLVNNSLFALKLKPVIDKNKTGSIIIDRGGQLIPISSSEINKTNIID